MLLLHVVEFWTSEKADYYFFLFQSFLFFFWTTVYTIMKHVEYGPDRFYCIPRGSSRLSAVHGDSHAVDHCQHWIMTKLGLFHPDSSLILFPPQPP